MRAEPGSPIDVRRVLGCLGAGGGGKEGKELTGAEEEEEEKEEQEVILGALQALGQAEREIWKE